MRRSLIGRSMLVGDYALQRNLLAIVVQFLKFAQSEKRDQHTLVSRLCSGFGRGGQELEAAIIALSGTKTDNFVKVCRNTNHYSDIQFTITPIESCILKQEMVQCQLNLNAKLPSLVKTFLTSRVTIGMQEISFNKQSLDSCS